MFSLSFKILQLDWHSAKFVNFSLYNFDNSITSRLLLYPVCSDEGPLFRWNYSDSSRTCHHRNVIFVVLYFGYAGSANNKFCTRTVRRWPQPSSRPPADGNGNTTVPFIIQLDIKQLVDWNNWKLLVTHWITFHCYFIFTALLFYGPCVYADCSSANNYIPKKCSTY